MSIKLFYPPIVLGSQMVRLFTVLVLFLLSPALFALPTGFIHLKYVDPSIIQEIRYASTNNFVGKRIDGYQRPECILTRDTVFALVKIQQQLNRHNLSLKVFDCYRPQRAVDEFIAWRKDPQDQTMKDEYYPRVNKADLFRLNYIAARSGHTRGSTVDLTVVTFKKGRAVELDMGTHFDYLDPSSHPDSTQVSENARHNRMQLRRIMEDAGFTPLETEWWHFTLENEAKPDTYYDFPVT